MKNIKFRIWDDEKEQMTYSDNWVDISWAKIQKAIDEERLMISTGLKDAKKNYIFEGDYVNIYNTYKEKYYKGKIKYIPERGEFIVESASLTSHNRWINYQMLVVGNIYENPAYLVKEEE